MSHLMNTYTQFPIELVDGHDYHLVDNHGKEYLDLTSGIGVCNFGYSNQAIQTAVADQLQHLWHVSNLYPNQTASQVADELCPAGYQAFFCNSGAEANEAAIKLAHKATGKKEIIAFDYGFHGRTLGSLSVTGYPHIKDGFNPLMPAVKFVNYNDGEALKDITPETAAVILEVIQGEGGVNNVNPAWLKKVSQRCQATETLLIVDEVQTGMGRTGYKFAYEQFGIEPDIITAAKGLANGLPVGAMLAKDKVAQNFKPGDHGTTFGGNKVVMASAQAVLKQLTPEFLAAVREKGNHLFKLLEEQVLPLPMVTSITGKGLMVGIHLNEKIKVADVIAKLQQGGILTLSARGNTLRLLPPLIISEVDLGKAVQQIAKVIKSVSK